MNNIGMRVLVQSASGCSTITHMAGELGLTETETYEALQRLYDQGMVIRVTGNLWSISNKGKRYLP